MLYICFMVLCTGSLLVFNNALVKRTEIQVHRIDYVLSYDSMHHKGQLWDGLQRSYDCCGRQNASDYNWSHLPESCCSVPTKITIGYLTQDIKKVLYMVNECNLNHAHRTGCVEALSSYVKHVTRYLSFAAFAFGCIAMMGCFASCATWYGFVGLEKTDRIWHRPSVSTA